MNAQRIVGLALLAVGIVLLIMGIRASDSFASQFSKFFTSEPTDRAIWLTLGGVALIVAGAAAALVPRFSRDR
jgi:hypothetical protein